MSNLEFERVRPRLVAAYDRGLLVPFIGSGMSIGACPDWQSFVAQLEQDAGIPGAQKGDAASGSAALIRRADRAVRAIRRQGTNRLGRSVWRALYDKLSPDQGGCMPPQMVALANIWWPLVLTSNYDDLFETQFAAKWRGASESAGRARSPASRERSTAYPSVLGRSPDDCHRVLESLTVTLPPILWALQGHLTRSSPESSGQPLASELVIGHEDYRRVTHREAHFRRAFSEVFRRRSLLFLGFGLAEQYFLDLFGEVLELLGSNPQPHYAFVDRSSGIDAEFLRTRFNILVVEYEPGQHDEIRNWLEQLRSAIQGSRSRKTAWALSVQPSEGDSAARSEWDLMVVDAKLTGLGDGEAAALSAGLVGAKPHPSGGIKDFAENVWKGFHADARAGRLSRNGQYLYEDPRPREGKHCPLVAVSAWVDPRNRDLRLIGGATEAALDWAAGRGYGILRSQLLAAGESRHFPARFSLVEMVRAYGRWKRRSRGGVRLIIHVIDEPVLFELRSGRLDLLELVTAPNIRFEAEISDSRGVVERDFFFLDESDTVEAVAKSLQLGDAHDWTVDVDPVPNQEDPSRPLGAAAGMTLREAGVLPGSTLRFTRMPRAQSRRSEA